MFDTSYTEWYSPAMTIGMGRVRARIAELGVRHSDVARVIGLHPTVLSVYLRGRRPAPADFERRAMEALDLIERAEQAADTARARVLSGQPPEAA